MSVAAEAPRPTIERRRKAYKPTEAERAILDVQHVDEMLAGRTLVKKGDKIGNPHRKGGRSLLFIALVLDGNGLAKYALARQENGIDRYLRPEDVRKVR